MKNTVIYHSADYDGRFCEAIARKFLPPDTEFIGWNFGDPPIAVKTDMLYVMDLPLDSPFGIYLSKGTIWIPCESTGYTMGSTSTNQLVWIDHHKTSIETHPSEIPGYRIDGVAACRLAWQWFTFGVDSATKLPLPSKQDFIDRKVSEPLAVRLAGEYDVWDKRDPEAEVFQFGLRSEELTPEYWSALLGDETRLSLTIVHGLLTNGRLLQRYRRECDAAAVKSAWLLKWEGMTFLAMNHQRGFNSLTFTARDVPETGHDALLGFNYNGAIWTVSLYHAKHRTDLDLSEIAKRHGGGGHRGACGFTCQKLPFIP